MARTTSVLMGRVGTVARCAEWLSEDWPPDIRYPLISAGSYPTGRPYASGQPRGPPKSAGPDCTRPSDLRSRRQMIVMTMLAEAKPKRQQATRQHESAPIPGLRRVPHPVVNTTKEQTMLALQAAAHGAHSVDALLIAISVLAVLFWKAALKIILILLVIATLITITFGAAAVLAILGHMIR
jgi:hypothetical protein